MMKVNLSSRTVLFLGVLIVATLTGLVLGILAVAPDLPARTPEPPKDLKDINLEAFGLKPVPAHKGPKTGFVVGGKNPTALIKELKEINGRTIAELEKDMRPGAKSEVGSRAGFLGPEESFLDVLAEDNRYVVDELGLTHQHLARPLHTMGAVGGYDRDPKEFLYHGRRVRVKVIAHKGSQLSPFSDDTSTSRDAIVENLDNGKTLKYSLLVPHMIERYGFYEGKGTPYRVEPRQVIELFDFLTDPSVVNKGAPEEKTVTQTLIRWVAGVGVILAALTGGALIWLRKTRSRRSLT
jgi:hypothetical protein